MRGRAMPVVLLALAAVVAIAAAAATAADADPRRSGYQTMSPALQAMQRDDAANPAMLWVGEGQVLWRRACAACHGEAQRSMAGVAARYPAFDAALGRPLTLAQRIGAHVTLGEGEALAVLAFVALQSRGLPIAPPADDARLRPFVDRGQALFERRIGQLNLSCAQCHDARAGLRLGGSLIPQGHPTGYPLYRLEWQALGSLQRRLRNCVVGVRAEPWGADAIELVELELYLNQRAAGMALDAPALRP
ncbi:MAG: sulfur oxidation c-type cytochrome SoxA [Burkholderiaceae bacterium]